MKGNQRFHRMGAWACTAALVLSLLPVSSLAAGTPAASKNIHKNDYTTWSAPVTSYLYENEAGGLTRVEYTGGQVVIEDYSADFSFQSSRTIAPELPLWGGFYAGKTYNFLIFGQKNPSESNSTEVIRVVKYDKDWNRLGAASLKGANTTVPFDAGSLRCDEYGGYLYIRTCHEMYTSDDGLNHQSNLTMAVRESDMSITDSFSDVMNISYGYVSHSFNQYILVDQDGKIIALDHGDAYPRSAVLVGYYSNASTGKFSGARYSNWCWNMDLLTFAGNTGDNTTGGSVGGLAETSDGYVMTYNYDGTGGRGDRTIYFQYMDKATGKGRQYKLNGSAGSTTPMLAPTGLDGGYVLWNGKSGYTTDNTLYYIPYTADGIPSEPQTASAPLSDCQPIPYDGGVVWYVTDNSVPTFYVLDGSGVTSYPAGGGSQSQTTPTPTPTPSATPTPTPSAAPTPTPTPTNGAPTDPRAASSIREAVNQADALAGRFTSQYDFTVAIDGSGTLWGIGEARFLNSGGSGQVSKPTALLQNVRQVDSTDGFYTAILAVKEDNTLWGWGYLGTIGFADDRETFVSTPKQLMDQVQWVSGGTFGAMVLKTDGSLFFLGSPSVGQDGSGQYQNNSVNDIYPVMGQVAKVCYANYRAVALKTDGSVWVWGADGYTGDDKVISTLGDQPQKPTKVLDGMISVGMDGENGWAIDANGGLWSWGYNGTGYVGNGGAYDTVDSTSGCTAQVKPVKILDRDVISASLGMAVTKDGSCYTWGMSDDSQEDYSSTPVRTGSGMVIASDLVKTSGQLMAPDPSNPEKTLLLAEDVFQTGSGSVAPQPTPVSFSDVPSNAWYAQYAKEAAQAGLMKGTGGTSFSPNATLSTAEVVTLTARLHAERNGKTVPQSSGAWYQGAYDYCVDNGLFTWTEVPQSSLTKTATRYQMVDLLDRAVPDSEKQAIKTISDGDIPDLRQSDPYGSVVYQWYRAGIVEGDSTHRFNGSTNISRAETAAILCRLAGLTSRV